MNKTPRVDALTALWDDDGASRGSAYIELRNLAWELEKQNAELLAALKDITALAPAGSLAQHKAYFAIAAHQPSTQEVSNEG